MKRTTEEIMNDFVDLAGALSSENLYYDGMATPEEVEINSQSIHNGWKELEKEIGYKVSVDEAWDWWESQTKAIEEALNPKENTQPEQEVKKKYAFGLKRK
jgi:hypothetical protein